MQIAEHNDAEVFASRKDGDWLSENCYAANKIIH
jgi:hypothetical protein